MISGVASKTQERKTITINAKSEKRLRAAGTKIHLLGTQGKPRGLKPSTGSNPSPSQ